MLETAKYIPPNLIIAKISPPATKVENIKINMFGFRNHESASRITIIAFEFINCNLSKENRN